MSYDQFTSQFTELNTKNLNSLFALTEKAIARSQQLAEINFDATKSLLGEAQDSIESIISAKDPQAFASLVQEGAFEEIGNKIYAQQQAVAKVVREANEEAAQLAEVGVEQFQLGLKDWVNAIAANAPAGSDAFVSALKTSVETSLQGLSQFQAAAKEAAATAEATAEQAVSAFKGQVASVKKATTKATAKPAVRTRRTAR